ncbi:MAG: RNA polymerase sigma factor [Gemmatimonadaceae bacterium]
MASKLGQHDDRYRHAMSLSLVRTTDYGNGSNVTHLLQRAQSGDDDAFEALYRQNVGRVYALSLRLAGDAQRAEELTQDVFVKAWEKLRSFRGDSAFSSWLYRLAVNIALNTRRSERRRLDRTGDLVLELTDGTVARGERFGAHTRVQSADIDLERAIASLPSGARAVFVLHDIEGFKHEEIANMTGMAIGTSKSHLFRARRLLREALER